MTAEHRGQHDTQVRGSAGGEHDGVDDVVAAISARAGTFQAAAAAKNNGRHVSLAVSYVQIYNEVRPGRCCSPRHRHAF